MPKTNKVSDRAHVILSFDLNQRDFDSFVNELKSSKYFTNLIGIEVKRPNYGNPVVALGALLLREPIVKEAEDVESDTAAEEEESDVSSESILQEEDGNDDK